MKMATPKFWGFRFTSQVWNFFRRTFKVNPNTLNKRQLTQMLKERSVNKGLIGSMSRDDKQMLGRLVKNEKMSKLW